MEVCYIVLTRADKAELKNENDRQRIWGHLTGKEYQFPFYNLFLN